MPPIITETGKQFDDAQDCLAFIRDCEALMLDPGASLVQSSTATVEMVYAFQALDKYLRRGGELPITWEYATSPLRRDTPG